MTDNTLLRPERTEASAAPAPSSAARDAARCNLPVAVLVSSVGDVQRISAFFKAHFGRRPSRAAS